MATARVVSERMRTAASAHPQGAREYELVSTRPLPLLEIPVTLTLLLFGAKTNDTLIAWYGRHRVLLTRFSNAARLLAVTSWFIPIEISRAVMLPLLVCGLPKLVCTLLLLSAPILRMLMTQYEFWFTTTLNTLGMILFANQIGRDIRLGYPLLTFMSIQVTICSDADVYTISETARAGVLSSVCALALGFFSLHRSVYLKSLPPSSSRDWNLAQVNFMTNVSITLAIFVINKSYKRRFVFWQHLRPFVPLAVCRAKLSVRRKRQSKALPTSAAHWSPQVPSLAEATASTGVNASPESLVTAIVAPIYSSEPVASQTTEGRAVRTSVRSGGRRHSSCALSRDQILHFRVVPLACQTVDANHTLAPSLCVKRPLSAVQYALLTLCGALGLSLALASLCLITFSGERSHSVLLPLGALSLLFTAVYCLTYAVHFQRELCRVLLRNFDFWFTLLQFLAATVCLADLLGWDHRCLDILSWALWFVWVLFADALLPTWKRKLHFKKRHASPVLVALLFYIVVLAYTLARNPRHVLHNRVLDVGTVAGVFTIMISTGTFMAYRLATLGLWTLRLAWRLCFRPDDEMILLRGALEFRNPFFLPTVSRRSHRESAT